jgi:hypothetical protein
LTGKISPEKVPGATPAILALATDAYRTAYSQAIRTVFLATIAFGTLSVIASLCCPNRDDSMKNMVMKTLHRPTEKKDLEIALKASEAGDNH